ncbi:hypothetical protein QVD17_10082 [Tagetes erecta]|uniref:Uncharacterized protein n=1 Tax=Tagetes erecta TaxID=13708 RepID=A0AAD8L5U6_TARER|nr:hypothetical protein QVD17_10082 [Tagetes erecta]
MKQGGSSILESAMDDLSHHQGGIKKSFSQLIGSNSTYTHSLLVALRCVALRCVALLVLVEQNRSVYLFLGHNFTSISTLSLFAVHDSFQILRLASSFELRFCKGKNHVQAFAAQKR